MKVYDARWANFWFSTYREPLSFWHYKLNWNLDTCVAIMEKISVNWQARRSKTTGGQPIMLIPAFRDYNSWKPLKSLMTSNLYSNAWHCADVSKLFSQRNVWLSPFPVVLLYIRQLVDYHRSRLLAKVDSCGGRKCVWWSGNTVCWMALLCWW